MPNSETLVKVKISDGRTVELRRPGPAHIGAFMRSLVAMDRVIGVVKGGVENVLGARGEVPDVDDWTVAQLSPLLAAMSGLPLEDVAALAAWDWLALLMALNDVLPANFLAEKTASGSEPSRVEPATSSQTGPAV